MEKVCRLQLLVITSRETSMSAAFQTLLFFLLRHAHRELLAENDFLKTQNEILRQKLGKNHIVLDHAARSRLMKFGDPGQVREQEPSLSDESMSAVSISYRQGFAFIQHIMM